MLLTSTSHCDRLTHCFGAVTVAPVTPSLVATAIPRTSEYTYRVVLAVLSADPCLCDNWRPAAFGSRDPSAKTSRWSLLHPTPNCDLTASSPAHVDASPATRSRSTALTYVNCTRSITATMANINWRTINIDALDPDSPANFDLSSLTPAVEPISTADVQNTSQQIRQLLRGGDNEGALQGALESAPYGADDKGKVRWCLLP